MASTYAAKNDQGEVLAHRPRVAKALKAKWGNIFGKAQQGVSKAPAFLAHYGVTHNNHHEGSCKGSALRDWQGCRRGRMDSGAALKTP